MDDGTLSLLNVTDPYHIGYGFTDVCGRDNGAPAWVYIDNRQAVNDLQAKITIFEKWNVIKCTTVN